jgi:hypothetical protein
MNHATSTEEAKVLIPKSRLFRFGESLVHLALLAITPYILSLNFRYTYWSDTGAPSVNTKLEAFQFAAKLYEILICASLASTTLYLLRRALWSSEGVSLGSLVASYGFGDTSIFLSPAFLGRSCCGNAASSATTALCTWDFLDPGNPRGGCCWTVGCYYTYPAVRLVATAV